MMRNMAGMMKKVQDMQARLENLQTELDAQHFRLVPAMIMSRRQ